MRITREHIGKKVKKLCWDKAVLVSLLSDEGYEFCGKNDVGELGVYLTRDSDSPWELVEPKKKPSEIIIANASSRLSSRRLIAGGWTTNLTGAILDYLDEQAESKE